MAKTFRHSDIPVKSFKSNMKKKSASLKQRYMQALQIDEWYIETPFRNRLRKEVRNLV